MLYSVRSAMHRSLFNGPKRCGESPECSGVEWACGLYTCCWSVVCRVPAERLATNDCGDSCRFSQCCLQRSSAYNTWILFLQLFESFGVQLVDVFRNSRRCAGVFVAPVPSRGTFSTVSRCTHDGSANAAHFVGLRVPDSCD